MFEEFGTPIVWPWSERRLRSPAVDVYDKDNQVLVEAEMPGIPKEAIQITCSDHTLVIRGETSKEKEEKKEGYYRSERSQASFYRAVPLPVEVDVARATAEVHNGVLKVSLPKVSAPEQKATSIPVSG